ncbi:hypothetical protein [Paenibacillus donghaensis]|uniref:Uncharacterized protein n=1 Tax=Paenibacillus donghaensis TaxID=414771 RepID=A0A2Z2KTT0_9BACL|nr:hypothetical protein [Paenibacillus donghaensis]ASA22948.1 hypothetical protein B9T62_20340 [Paenibacillus donghaensis]
MSEQLSRVKSRQKQYNRQTPPAVKEKKVAAQTAVTKQQAPAQPSRRATASAGLSRKVRLDAAQKQAGSTVSEGENVPSRTKTYNTDRFRFSKIFVNSLIALFVVLLLFLLYWGLIGAPDLKDLW